MDNMNVGNFGKRKTEGLNGESKTEKRRELDAETRKKLEIGECVFVVDAVDPSSAYHSYGSLLVPKSKVIRGVPQLTEIYKHAFEGASPSDISEKDGYYVIRIHESVRDTIGPRDLINAINSKGLKKAT